MDLSTCDFKNSTIANFAVASKAGDCFSEIARKYEFMRLSMKYTLQPHGCENSIDFKLIPLELGSHEPSRLESYRRRNPDHRDRARMACRAFNSMAGQIAR